MDDGTRKSDDWLDAAAEVGRLLRDVEEKYEPQAFAVALMVRGVRYATAGGDLNRVLRYLSLAIEAEEIGEPPVKVPIPARPIGDVVGPAPGSPGTVTVRLPAWNDEPQRPPPGKHLMGAVMDKPGMPGYFGCTLCGERVGFFDQGGPCRGNPGPSAPAPMEEFEAVMRQMMAERPNPPDGAG